jgi:hypothetical protein
VTLSDPRISSSPPDPVCQTLQTLQPAPQPVPLSVQPSPSDPVLPTPGGGVPISPGGYYGLTPGAQIIRKNSQNRPKSAFSTPSRRPEIDQNWPKLDPNLDKNRPLFGQFSTPFSSLFCHFSNPSSGPATRVPPTHHGGVQTYLDVF